MPRRPDATKGPYAKMRTKLDLSPPPEADPCARMMHEPWMKYAQKLAMKHGLDYLTPSGLFKLSKVIADARSDGRGYD